VQPSRFELTYVNKEGETETPVMIHCALLGSVERFMSVYIEHRAGWFDFWSAPEQIRILTVNNTVDDYVEEVSNRLKGIVLSEPVKFNELRYSSDLRNESLGKKIREASSMKIPVQIIVGPKDKDARCVSVRMRNNDDFVEEKIQLDDIDKFIKTI